MHIYVRFVSLCRWGQVNNILQARNEELEKTMAAKGVGFLEEAAKAEGAVKTDRCGLISEFLLPKIDGTVVMVTLR